MNIYLGILSPIGLVSIISIYLLLTLSALFIIFRREGGMRIFLWTLFVVMLPLFGGVLYIFKYFIENKTNKIA